VATADTARLVAELTLKDKLSAGVRTATASVNKLDKKFGNLNKSISKGASNAGRNIGRGIELGALAAGGALIYATKQASDFEAQMNIINTVAKKTGDAFTGELGGIGDRIRQLARDTGTSTEDLTQAYYDLVSAGISAADSQKVLVAANTLAIGGLSTTAEAVDLLTTAINSYGGDATKATKYANMFAEAIAAGKVTAAEIAASFAQVGPIAAKFGVGVNQIAASLGVMTAQGTPAAEAMTQIRAAIVALQKPNAAMVAFQKKVGINFETFAKKNGLAKAYDVISKKAKALGIPMGKLTGRLEAVLFAAQVSGPALAKYEAELDKVNKSSENGGEAARQMAERTKGFAFALGRLQTNLNDAAITIGAELLPPLADLASEMTDFVSAHQPEIKRFAQDLATGFKDAVGWLKGLNWGAITASLQAAAGFAKGLVEAFLGMPSWVQTAVITGWGLNKLTGGALTDIVGELGKGLIKGVLGINAGIVHVNGPVAGGGPTPSGPGGFNLTNLVQGGIATLLGIGAAQGIKQLGDAIVGPISAATGLLRDDIQQAADRSRTQSFGFLESLRLLVFDFNGTMDRTNDALGQVSTFLSTPHPDFLGDLGDLLGANYHPKPGMLTGPTGGPTGFSEPGIRAIEAAKLAQVTAIRETGSTTGTILRESSNAQETATEAVRQATRGVDSTARSGLAGTTGAVNSAASRITSAISSNRPIVTTTVEVNVTPTNVQKQTTTSTRYGPINGSAGGGGSGHGGGGSIAG